MLSSFGHWFGAVGGDVVGLIKSVIQLISDALTAGGGGGNVPPGQYPLG
jgi:hypothetical protein